jgi:hypothetical protein
MHQFMNFARNIDIIRINSIDEIKKPAVVILEDKEICSLKLLPALFGRHPIYHLKQGENLAIEFHGKSVDRYSGEMSSK